MSHYSSGNNEGPKAFLSSTLGSRLFRTLLQHKRIGVIVTDLEGQIVWASEGMRHICGYDLSEMAGRRPGDFLQGTQTDPQVVATIREKLSQGASFCVELINYRKDKSFYWVELDIEPMRDEQGVVTHFLGVQKDITERKLREEKSKDMETLLNETATLVHVGSWEVDLATMQPQWSDEVYRIHGLPIGEKPDLADAINFYAPEARPIISAAVERGIATGEPWDMELPFINAQGEHLWVRAVGRPVQENGKTVRLWGMFQDITNQKNAGARLKIVSERLGLATKAAGIGIWDWNVVKNELIWDDQMYRLYGVQEENFSGAYEAWYSGLHPEDAERCQPLIEDALAGIKPFDTTFRVIWPSGEIRRLRASSVVEFDDHGKPLRMLGTNWDVTDEYRYQEELVRARDEAEAGIKARSRFLATMSHEIRTPLNGIIGMVSLLKEDKRITNEPRELVETIDESSVLLMHILNDVLDFSKIDAGQLQLEEISFNVATVMHQVVSICGASAREKGIELELEQSPEAWVMGDPQRLTQVVLNLATNAVKFTHEGRVTLRCFITRERDRRRIRVEVEDTGIGIPENKRANLFKPFYQADASTKRRFGGTGLGLSICKLLMEQFHGEIYYESRPGSGSTFWITLSLPEGKKQVTRERMRGDALPTSFTSKRFLLVEDNPINQKVILRCLKRLGIECDHAENGAVGVAMVKTKIYDFIFMDCNMPVMNGFEATKQIRAMDEPRRNAVIIAFTANAMKEDRDNCLAAGMNDYISKPISIGKLQNHLIRWAEP